MNISLDDIFIDTEFRQAIPPLDDKEFELLEQNILQEQAVQGDSGHSQAQMVTNQYSHILDEDRVHNAKLFEEAFYKNSGEESQPMPETKEPDTSNNNNTAISSELIAKVLQSPELVALIQAIGQTNNTNNRFYIEVSTA